MTQLNNPWHTRRRYIYIYIYIGQMRNLVKRYNAMSALGTRRDIRLKIDLLVESGDSMIING